MTQWERGNREKLIHVDDTLIYCQIIRDSVPKVTWVFAIYEKWVLVKFMKPLGSLFV